MKTGVLAARGQSASADAGSDVRPGFGNHNNCEDWRRGPNHRHLPPLCRIAKVAA